MPLATFSRYRASSLDFGIMTMKQFRSRRFRSSLIAFLLFSGLCVTAKAEMVTFGNFSQFKINQDDSGSAPILSIANERIQLTNAGSSYQARSVFYKTPVNISGPFKASFVYQANQTAFVTYDLGLTFTIQNSAEGANAIGDTWYNLGYSGIANSVALSLELGNGSRAGQYMNGNKGFSQGQLTSPLNFDLGHAISVEIFYDGSILSETLTDVVTNAVYSADYLLDIPEIVGSNAAFVGFTGSTGSSNTRDQYISRFKFEAVPEASSIVLMTVASLGAVAFRLRHRFTPQS